MATVLETAPAATVPGRREAYLFTVEQYHHMIRHGILKEDDPVELVEGWVVKKMPHNPPHDGIVWILQSTLELLVAPHWIVRTQSAITTRDSEPEPDIVVARAPGSQYV